MPRRPSKLLCGSRDLNAEVKAAILVDGHAAQGKHTEALMQVSAVAQLSNTPEGKAILEIAGRPMFELNRVASGIWTKLLAGHSPKEISSEIAREFCVSEDVATQDVGRFIETLKLHCLLYDDE